MVKVFLVLAYSSRNLGEERGTYLVGQCERIDLGNQWEKQMSHVVVTECSHGLVLLAFTAACAIDGSIPFCINVLFSSIS